MKQNLQIEEGWKHQKVFDLALLEKSQDMGNGRQEDLKQLEPKLLK